MSILSNLLFYLVGMWLQKLILISGIYIPNVFVYHRCRCTIYSNGFYPVYRRVCFPSGTSCHSFTFK